MKGKIIAGLLTASLALTSATMPALANPGHHGGGHRHSHSQSHHGHGGNHRHWQQDGHRHHGDHRHRHFRNHHDHDDFGDDAAVFIFGTALGAMMEQGNSGN